MSFYHFINCVALTFLPLFFVFKFTPLSENGSIYRCSFALLGYILTQLLKLLIMATLLIPSTIWDHLVDCMGLYYILINQQKASLVEVKILGVAVGWNFGESLSTRFIDFYVNARSMQFDWKHILSALEANVSLVQTINLCCLLWTWHRSGKKLPLVVITIYCICHTLIGTNLLVKCLLLAAISFYTLLTLS